MSELNDAEKKEAAIIASAINVVKAGTERSVMGDMFYYKDENPLNKNPNNLIINNASFGVFQLILGKKIGVMYENTKKV